MPHLSLLFARRYLFSKKSHSVINVISGVSAVAVAVPVMAMVMAPMELAFFTASTVSAVAFKEQITATQRSSSSLGVA